MMNILTHDQIWAAIDKLAEQMNLSVSALARKSGLDPTTFNRSKRFTASERERWPSTESIAKVLQSTNTPIQEFMFLVEEASATQNAMDRPYVQNKARNGVPLIGFAQAGVGGFFDDGGFPVGQGWEEVPLPTNLGDSSYALEVSGDSMEPLYRDGDVIIVDPSAQLRKGDRVVAKTLEGEVLAKTLLRKTSKVIELQSINPDYDDLSFKPEQLEWLARIVWASQ